MAGNAAVFCTAGKPIVGGALVMPEDGAFDGLPNSEEVV